MPRLRAGCRIGMVGFVVGLALALASTGCGHADGGTPVFSVRGEFFVDGQPAEGAMVSFHPLNDPDPRALRSYARVEGDGGYHLSTFLSGDGAPQGEYVVTVYWPDPRRKGDDPDGESETLPPDRLRGRFATPGSSVLCAAWGRSPRRWAASTWATRP